MSWNEVAMTGHAVGADRSGGGATGPLEAPRVPDRSAVTPYEAHGARVVVASGDYDMQTIAPLAAALRAAAEEHPSVVLDVSGVTFADSAFLNLLILTHRTTDLRLAGPTAPVRRILELTGVDTVLKVRETVEDAAAC
ncbi:STAS domain-containing protein [Streptomyces sp. WAC08241]|uniref:STAS domain-containing protein n=1 Tax=Streptomyces sp. WAC08241 TaxID=2487421 RepID=UPI0021AFE4A7|nr:STAS domain-containing protein [Streptomyces sp. WAC08241]